MIEPPKISSVLSVGSTSSKSQTSSNLMTYACSNNRHHTPATPCTLQETAACGLIEPEKPSYAFAFTRVRIDHYKASSDPRYQDVSTKHFLSIPSTHTKKACDRRPRLYRHAAQFTLSPGQGGTRL